MPRMTGDPLPAHKSAARMAAVQALYLMELTGLKSEKVIADFLAGHIPADASGQVTEDFDGDLFTFIVQEAVSKREDIDKKLTASLDPRWPLARLEKTLRALLRAGAAEILAGDVDVPIVINDYINVAHGFFSGKEPQLANAVLDKLAKNPEKPGRARKTRKK